MKSYSRMKRRSRWFLAAAAVLALCLPVDSLQLAGGQPNALTIAQLSEAGGGSLGQNSAMLVPINLPASWQGLFAAGRW